MTDYRHYFIALAAGLLTMSTLNAQDTPNDSIPQEGRRSNQNVMLNASSATVPRTISLGIPSSGSAIFEDGLPVSFYLGFFPGHWSWHNGLNTESMSLSTLDESALRVGIIGYFPSTTSKVTADRLSGGANYSVNIYGQHQLDLNVGAPLGHGWGFNLNTYQNFDRGSNHLDMSYLTERIQFYKAALSKTFAEGRGRASLTYNYMSTMTVGDNYGPFIFVGDGSVKPFEDFDLGHDQYLPNLTGYRYIDPKDGQMKSRNMTDDGLTKSHMATFNLTYRFNNGNELDFRSRLKTIHTDVSNLMLTSISQVGATDGYTYSDGTPFAGNVQGRLYNNYDTTDSDWMNTIELRGKNTHHDWYVAADAWFDHTSQSTFTGNFAHEAKKDPKQLYYNGQDYWVFNTGSNYFNGNETKLAIYARDQWKPTQRLTLTGGVRLEYMNVTGKAANNVDGATNNSRTPNWSLLSPGVAKNRISENWLNTAATFTAYYRLTPGFALQADALATYRRPEITEYGTAMSPVTDVKSNYMFRAGINYRNSWIDAQSLLTYLVQKNDFVNSLWTHTLTKAAGGYPEGYQETVYIPSFYNIDAFGWTTDIVLTPFRGFTFHGLINLRAPRYRDYKFEPVFSDGYSETYDFSDKKVTGISSVEIELEPSYTIDKWRIWASARYYSRQYINRTNTLYFNPRWETFGGVDYNMSQNVSFGVNVINFLNQKGASAGIQAASLATDASKFQNYLTSGTYIRPFTVEFSTRIKF